MSQSDRAEGRVRDLRAAALGWLQGHAPLTDRLEQVASITDGTAVIVAAPLLQMWHDDGTDDPPDAAIGVKAVTSSSTRENMAETKSMTLQADLQVRSPTLESQGLAWHDEIVDEISAVLTTHHPPWSADGETGGTPEALWDDQRNRYRSVRRFDYQRRD